jgi:Domain of unknown function (DUF4082)/Bacterial Ig-like domain/Bacterial Ig domain
MNYELEHTGQQFIKVMRSFLATVVLMGAWLVFDSGSGDQLAFAAPCDTPILNPIVCENSKPGNPASEWDISGAGSTSIQGFATDISVNQGETVHFKVDTDASAYRLDIYRMGYYGGMGARKVATVRPSVSLPQNQLDCLTNGSTGLIDCGNWAVSASWTVPTDATSGIYFAKLVRESGVSGASHIVFIVRDDDGGSDLLFQTSDTTWQAYNNYGGNSLYVGSPAGRAYKVSYNRPFNTRATNPEDWVFNAEYPMVRWLEANGYDVSYFTGVDSDRRGQEILKHKVFLSVGHDEYWSGGQRANVEAARNAGVHLAFFSGNEIFWKTRWESSIDGSGTPHRTLVCYKETHANAKIDPLPDVWTGTWRDPRFSPPADGGRPENALTGTIFEVNSGTSAIRVPAADGKMRFWRNTSIATLASGQTATLPSGTLGYEWDEEPDNGVRPAGLVRLSTTTVSGVDILLDYGSTYGSGTATHRLTLYRHSSGALVFGAGTIQWSWGLDSHHDRGSASPDVRMQQAMVNLFADMGLQPDTLQSGLVAATASTDTASPISTITAPAAGSTVQSGTPVTISGTATDAGGGVVGGVEVSGDGGLTWHPATGRENWSYSWTPGVQGSVTIMSRAVDDSGNLEGSPDMVTVTVQGKTCPCSLWSNATPPGVTIDADSAAVEVGVKFQAEVAGYITGLRFYKGSGNTGTHVGNLWSSSGTRLATATFTNETASGWQQVNLPSPVPISANATYVASYFAPSGHYAVNEGYFNTTFSNAPLQAPAGGNGVYVYGASSAFPTQTFNASNYWVDIVFATSTQGDATPPTVSTTSVSDGATNVDTNTNLTASFSEAMDSATINTNTVLLRDSAGNLVPVTVTYDAATRTVTLDPTASLAPSATYKVTIKGGANGVKDAAGNPLSADVTWSFTTAASSSPTCPCSLWSNATTPAVAADPDTRAIEVGVKFRPMVGGFITAIRFYKGTGNTGTHVGHLWTASGNLLASVTFTGESASGWQQASLSSPVAVTANTTYVASYRAPLGHYAADEGYFATAYSNGPLRALANGEQGSNGVYKYGTSGFPTKGFNASNYWVDVVFEKTLPSSSTAAANLAAGTSNPNASTYIGQTGGKRATGSALLPPGSPSANLTAGTAPLEDQAQDTAGPAGNLLSADVTSSLTVAAASGALSPEEGPGGPILVITSASNPFSRYYAEILRTEGLNAFAMADISSVSAQTLAGYDVVILGAISLTSAQVTMFSDWVNAGGNLIAMHPDKQLAGLLGLTDTSSILANAYLLVNTSTGPGVGIVGQTIQYRGIADRYTLSGASSLATLYTNATTATANPAVTLRSVGTNGGKAAAFTYDLALSVVDMRQGNTDWAGQERDGFPPKRPDDMFFGNASGDPQPDWVDLNKVAIPQADEQQRLLANLILSMNRDKKPLPRFWYFPHGKKAVVIMTGDDHANGGTAGRFDQYKANSPAGCSVADWECIRSTSYIYPTAPLTDAQAASYVTQGFEVGLHVTTGCDNWTTPSSLESFYSDQLTTFAATYPSVPAPTTNRTHCIVWSDYMTQPQVELAHGIRLDTTYYYWPPSWLADRPGFFTGSGMPMRFALLDGTMIDVYQAVTQMTDESGQTYPFTSNALLDKAIGSEGYYGAFTANMHTDSATSSGSDAIIASALTRGVPVVSAQQMLTWLDGRNSSSFGSLAWSGNTLSFTIAVGSGTNGLQAMVPTTAAVGALTGITRNGSPVSFTTQVVKGGDYAFFSAAVGSYQATYAPDTTPPTVGSTSVPNGSTDVDPAASFSITFSEAMDPATINTSTIELRDANGNLVPITVTYNAATHIATVDPSVTLAFGMTYTLTVKGGATGVKDQAGNVLAANFTSSFTTTSLTCPCSLWSDTTTPTVASANDPNAVELGVKFRSTVNGFITGLRFYKGASNTGTHVGNLWTSSGTPLASATFTSETASGWQQVGFAAPVAITANTTYVASYHTTAGNYAFDGAYFASSGVSNPPLRALANGEEGGNGVYVYGASAFPSQTFNSSNYWVDVVFTTQAPPSNNPVPTTSGLAPNSAIAGGAAFTLTVNGTNFVTNSVVRWNGADRPTTFVSATQLTAAIPSTDIAASGTASVTVFNPAPGGGTSNPQTFTISASAACPCSLWSAATVPAVAADNDAKRVEVGVKFQAQSDGYITGLRFYKGTTNTGVHVGTLWTAAGIPLTSVTFSGETASGWQQASFASPVPIKAGIIYVASYHTNTGHYAVNANYFTTAVTNGPLRALADGEAGGNGVYIYSASSAFPTESFNASNYWVDVVFTPSLPPGTFLDTTAVDFRAGLPEAGTYIGQTADGEVLLAPTLGTEFDGAALPTNWTAFAGTATVANGMLTVDGARAGTTATFGAGRSLEFVATFSGAANQNVGFGTDFSTAPWARFTTQGGNLLAQTRFGSTTTNTTLGSGRLGAPHRFRIDWNATNVVYSVDGTVVATHARASTTPMRPLVSDATVGGGTVTVDWLRPTPYAASGTFLSRVFDAGASVLWDTATWTSQLPSGTSLSISVRQGGTPTPDDGTWTPFSAPLAGSGATVGGTSRYLQYRAELTTRAAGSTPTLQDLTITYNLGGM